MIPLPYQFNEFKKETDYTERTIKEWGKSRESNGSEMKGNYDFHIKINDMHQCHVLYSC